jgi:hypothetical protein
MQLYNSVYIIQGGSMDDCTYSVQSTCCLSVVIHGFDICDGVELSSLQLKLECIVILRQVDRPPLL